MKNEILKHFEYDHLPDYLQDISKPFCDLANSIDANPLCTDFREKAVVLRKLLEAKDAAVRSFLPERKVD
jgi:hypothetical protein